MATSSPQNVAEFRIPGRESYGEAGDLQYASMLRYAGRVAKTFTPWPGRPNCAYVCGGANWYGAECTNAVLLFAAALRYGRYDNSVTAFSRDELVAKTIAVIRYISLTHDSGPADCVRVKGRNLHCASTKWGERAHGFFRQSQCGRSVFTLGLGAWLLWDRLDAETRLLVQAVVEDFEERFCEDLPRNGTYYDTQCEENGWTSQGLSIGPFMFPDHPRAAVWEEGYRRWALNTAVISADRRRDRRFLVTTLHPDFTTENHAFVHPDYLNAAMCLRGPIAILSLATGKPIAEEVLYHDEDIYDRALKAWVLQDGGSLYPQGQDWWYSKLSEFMFSHALMNVLWGREDAARYELENMKTCALLQDENGSLYPAHWAAYPVAPRDHELVEDMEIFGSSLTVLSYMLHAHGERATARPRPMAELLEEQAGTYVYPHGGLAIHRRAKSIATVSWRNNVNASTLPEDGYWDITPTYVNYVGVIERERVPETAVYAKAVQGALSHRLVDFGDGLALRARIGRLEARLLQDIAFVSLPTGDTVYLERVSAVRDCEPLMYETGIVGVRNENERALGDRAKGYRVLRFDDGRAKRYEGRYGGKDIVDRFDPPRYLAVDNRMAFLLHNSRGVAYVNIHDYPKWRGLEDLLILNSVSGGRAFGEGSVADTLVVVSLPNCGIEEAAERHRGFAVLEALPAGCEALRYGEYLVYANFTAARVSCQGRGSAGGAVRLFRGSTAVSGGAFVWKGDVEAGEAGYLGSRWAIRGSCEGLVAEISGSRSGTLLNGSGRTLSFELSGAGEPEWSAVTLPAGGFLRLE